METEKAAVLSRFPLLPRKKNSDKSNYGHVLVLAGSRGMPGAALLSGHSTLRSGAGLVTLGVPRGLLPLISKKAVPELMILGLKDTKSVSLRESAADEAFAFIRKRKISCVALGPGLSLHPETQKFARAVVKKSPIPVVLDADGLNSFKGRASGFLSRKAPLVITPHRREFERLFLRPFPEDIAARKLVAQNLSKTYDAVLVLKSHRTLVVDRERFFLNSTGNPGMAKGGSGDVLTGIIAAFIAQGLSPFESARWAVYFHGRAADLAVRAKGELGLLASDIIEYLPLAFNSKI